MTISGKAIFKNFAAILTVLLIMLSVTSFKTPEPKKAKGRLDYYLFLTAWPEQVNGVVSKKRYLSDIFYYVGYDECGEEGQYRTNAVKAYKDYLKIKYNVTSNSITVIYDKVGSTEKPKTHEEAEAKMNQLIKEEKERGCQIIKTDFLHKCGQ